MKFEDTFFSREHRFSIGVETESGRYYLSIPVSNGVVDYEEYYEIGVDSFKSYQEYPELANEFVKQCKNRQKDNLLILKSGNNRGVAC
ncbi:hypothetical protein [Vibrio caribbeanicus]|uniref:hypothetical protein n=1 Tax=Vibrio caribbeanicus TaxID=701175 RepID=UPI002283D1E7|nr:hypothetical protein [Vibrio caribbeanicus]MCY9844845.1 hypothetical protein [Vibrio caribbeanicus]